MCIRERNQSQAVQKGQTSHPPTPKLPRQLVLHADYVEDAFEARTKLAAFINRLLGWPAMASSIAQIRKSVLTLALPVTVSTLLQRTEGIAAVLSLIHISEPTRL